MNCPCDGIPGGGQSDTAKHGKSYLPRKNEEKPSIGD